MQKYNNGLFCFLKMKRHFFAFVFLSSVVHAQLTDKEKEVINFFTGNRITADFHEHSLKTGPNELKDDIKKTMQSARFFPFYFFKIREDNDTEEKAEKRKKFKNLNYKFLHCLKANEELPEQQNFEKKNNDLKFIEIFEKNEPIFCETFRKMVNSCPQWLALYTLFEKPEKEIDDAVLVSIKANCNNISVPKDIYVEEFYNLCTPILNIQLLTNFVPEEEYPLEKEQCCQIEDALVIQDFMPDMQNYWNNNDIVKLNGNIKSFSKENNSVTITEDRSPSLQIFKEEMFDIEEERAINKNHGPRDVVLEQFVKEFIEDALCVFRKRLPQAVNKWPVHILTNDRIKKEVKALMSNSDYIKRVSNQNAWIPQNKINDYFLTRTVEAIMDHIDSVRDLMNDEQTEKQSDRFQITKPISEDEDPYGLMSRKTFAFPKTREDDKQIPHPNKYGRVLSSFGIGNEEPLRVYEVGTTKKEEPNNHKKKQIIKITEKMKEIFLNDVRSTLLPRILKIEKKYGQKKELHEIKKSIQEFCVEHYNTRRKKNLLPRFKAEDLEKNFLEDAMELLCDNSEEYK